MCYALFHDAEIVGNLFLLIESLSSNQLHKFESFPFPAMDLEFVSFRLFDFPKTR